jgi:hypothetical protein
VRFWGQFSERTNEVPSRVDQRVVEYSCGEEHLDGKHLLRELQCVSGCLSGRKLRYTETIRECALVVLCSSQQLSMQGENLMVGRVLLLFWCTCVNS